MAKPAKIIDGKNYGSIPHLPGSKKDQHDKYLHDGQVRILENGGRDKHDKIYLSVKLDGTNVGVLKKGGELVALQRKGYACIDSPYQQHQAFATWVKEPRNTIRLNRLLDEGERLVGEWLWQASGIQYTFAHANIDPFVAFDQFKADGERYQWEELLLNCQMAGIQVPVNVKLNSFSVDKDADDSLDRFRSWCNPFIPFPAGTRHEGVVVRLERKSKLDFMAKWVRSDFVPGRFLPGIGLPEDSSIVINNYNLQ
ncbi:MAG: RNA ligase family protein [Bacteroidota bacterium]